MCSFFCLNKKRENESRAQKEKKVEKIGVLNIFMLGFKSMLFAGGKKNKEN